MAWRRLVIGKDLDRLPVGLAPTTAAALVLSFLSARRIDVVVGWRISPLCLVVVVVRVWGWGLWLRRVVWSGLTAIVTVVIVDVCGCLSVWLVASNKRDRSSPAVRA